MKPSKNLLAIILILVVGFVCLAAFGAGSKVKGVQDMRYGIDIRGGVEAIFEPQGINRKATNQELTTAREVIEMRMDSLNITDREVTIDKNGGYIIVRFPWKSDETSFNPEDAINELGDMAKLTFRDDKGNVILEGKNVRSSSVTQKTDGVGNENVVTLKFDEKGSKLFADATGKLIGKSIGIYMNDKQISNPRVDNKITGGEAYIEGMKDYNEAKKLSDKINSGALPFSLETTSFSTISPTLGNNALHIMIYAGLIAFLIVCLFMIFYYKLPGVVACITLVLQMALQLLAISIPQFTLTLPGIAGIILTLGMSVDANVIISERISEELKKGQTVRSAITAGYKHAFTSVLDGNVTTAIVAVILMIFGSGSMLSFGYTLLIGMIVNVAIGVTSSKHMLLSLTYFKKWNDSKWYREKKELKVRKFYQKKYVCAIISGTAILLGIAFCFINGVKLDTQFTGGVVMSYNITDGKIDNSATEKAIGKVTSRAITVQQKENRVGNGTSLEITLAGNGGIKPDEQKKITSAIAGTSKDAKVSLAQTYAVEPYIGAKALKNAIIAVAISLAFIMIYVWIRFKNLSGLPAGITSLVALFHDILVVFFAFVIFGIPLNDAFVAVVLTIIGYSINDTIVVYDRIRENRKTMKKMDVIELSDTSMSQVLSRSINSSVTTTICISSILVASVVFQINSIIYFSLPMFFGLISGCYSSIFIASELWAMWEKKKQKKQ
jgi:SecD/SecF fusion protein